MISYNTDISYPKVIDSTEWIDLDKYKGLETRKGVYILSNFFYQVKYVGWAGDGDLVKEISGAIKNGKSAGASKIKVLYTKSELFAMVLEKRLIDKYNPINNFK